MDAWDEGSHYDDYMGRWSRAIATEFLAWVDAPPGARWVDIGCGTGALTSAIIDDAAPHRVTGVDQSPAFIAAAKGRLGASAAFTVGDAEDLPFEDATFDVAVSGLALNFVPDPLAAVEELRRVVASDGVVAVYVWDYADGMEMIRLFWDIAVGLDPSISHLDEAIRFPLCNPTRLEELFLDAGLRRVEVEALKIPTVFAGFDDFWHPMLGGQGPIPSYVMSLSESDREMLRVAIKQTIAKNDEVITLQARAWAAKANR